MATAALDNFRARVDEVVHRHPIVVANAYTKWFATGQASVNEVRHLTVQFSVFSHLFIEAQLRKVINAATIESYRAGKQILMNELGGGVPTRARQRDTPRESSATGLHRRQRRGWDLPFRRRPFRVVEDFGEPWFNQEKYLVGASEMLEGVKAFWDGLWDDHLRSQKRAA